MDIDTFKTSFSSKQVKTHNKRLLKSFLKKLVLSLGFLALLIMVAAAEAAEKSVYDFEVKDIESKTVSMKSFEGKVLLIVNTASKCGFTPQLKDLVDLQKEYGPRGLQILAFPSNDFNQDKGSNVDSKEFAEKNYQINFPLMDKNPVSGDKIQPIYQFMSSQKGFPQAVMWNFEKFIVNNKGQVVERYRSMTNPSAPEVRALIEKLLAEKI